MASYKLKQDYTARGNVNVSTSGPGVNTAGISLTHNFLKDEVVLGTYYPPYIGGIIGAYQPAYILANLYGQSIKEDGSIYNGDSVFQIPISMVDETTAPSTSNSILTTKNIIIAIIVIGIVLGILKLAKVI